MEAAVYSGPRTGHPEATRLGTWTGWIQTQDFETEAAIRKAIRGDGSGLTGQITLEMDDGALVSGNITGEVGILTGDEAGVRMQITSWDEDVFQHAVVSIERDGRISVVVKINPPECGQETRPISPMVA